MPAAIGKFAVTFTDLTIAFGVTIDIMLEEGEGGLECFTRGGGQFAGFRVIAKGQKKPSRIGEAEYGAHGAHMRWIEEEARGLFFV